MVKVVYFSIVFCISISKAFALNIMGAEAPACVGNKVETNEQAKCIALFYLQFESSIEPLGSHWDVKTVKNGTYWLVYPINKKIESLTKPVMRINAMSGVRE